MLLLHSRIIVGAIHKGESILLHRDIELGLLRWEVATTTTMPRDIVKTEI